MRRRNPAAIPEYGIEEETALCLYALVRLTRPMVAVETGVADGISTELVLHAMARNEAGELHSIDIAGDVGCLVTNRARWRLHIVSPDSPSGCTQAIAGLDRLDLFFHDGNHEAKFQAAEYDAAWRRLRPGGMLVSDDVDWSYAFLDFLDAHDASPAMLLNDRKVFGIVDKPSA